ncbi:tautomerase family protein [Mesorhizobium sp. YR577]|uniref:tautomerase family protein n=1 Tax=Mesorhizobium sp. YR577 TaxID=1884373 RepID=UPI000B836896|nr:tautomerase family protein [Mesorhizobium sp. YR577]
MPLLKIHIHQGHEQEYIKRLLDAAHSTVVEAFSVPQTDRYQLLLQYEPGHMRALDTGFSFNRTDQFTLFEIISRPRLTAQKRLFFRRLCEELQSACGIAPSDVMICFVENTDIDWSFGGGVPQFVPDEQSA